MLNFILLLLVTPASGEVRCRPASQEAAARLSLADQATARHDFKLSNRKLDEAFQVLGNAYASNGTIDDTGMHLVIAESQERRGNLKLASELKRRLLIERLELCRQPSRSVPVKPIVRGSDMAPRSAESFGARLNSP